MRGASHECFVRLWEEEVGGAEHLRQQSALPAYQLMTSREVQKYMLVVLDNVHEAANCTVRLVV